MEGLGAFREKLYACYTKHADALFELTDAILTAGSVPSPPSEPHWRTPTRVRKPLCGLEQGKPHGEQMQGLLAGQRLANDLDRARVYAVDRSSWPRCDAETSPGRGYYYHPSRHSTGQPIVAGWDYQLVAEFDFSRASWVALADARSMRPEEDTALVAADQVRGLLRRMPEHSSEPLFVVVAGYDPVRLQLEFEHLSA